MKKAKMSLFKKRLITAGLIIIIVACWIVIGVSVTVDLNKPTPQGSAAEFADDFSPIVTTEIGSKCGADNNKIFYQDVYSPIEQIKLPTDQDTYDRKMAEWWTMMPGNNPCEKGEFKRYSVPNLYFSTRNNNQGLNLCLEFSYYCYDSSTGLPTEADAYNHLCHKYLCEKGTENSLGYICGDGLLNEENTTNPEQCDPGDSSNIYGMLPVFGGNTCADIIQPGTNKGLCGIVTGCSDDCKLKGCYVCPIIPSDLQATDIEIRMD